MRVLVVCSGNICRSPMGEGLLRHRLVPDEEGRVEISSAGTLGIVGQEADPDAVAACAEAGFDIAAHRSRALDASALQRSDVVLVMEHMHLREATRLAPRHPRIVLLGSFLPAASRALSGEEIADPLGGGLPAFRRCLRSLELSVEGFLRQWRESEGRSEESSEEGAERRYFGGIQARVLAARGGGPGLTSMEFHVVDGWWKQGVPLWIVLEAITETESAWPPGEAPRGFIRKVEAEVSERFESSGVDRETGPDAAARPDADDHGWRDRAIASMKEARKRMAKAHPFIEEILDDLVEELATVPAAETDPADLLARGRQRLVDSALRSLPLGGRESLLREEEARLAGLGNRLSPQAREETLRRLLADRVLSWFDLPDLMDFTP